MMELSMRNSTLVSVSRDVLQVHLQSRWMQIDTDFNIGKHAEIRPNDDKSIVSVYGAVDWIANQT